MTINKLSSKLLEKKSDKDPLLTWSQTGVACSGDKSDPHSDPTPSLLAKPPTNSSRAKTLLSPRKRAGKHLDLEKVLNLSG